MPSSERHRVKFAVYTILRDGNKVLLSLRQNTGWKDGWYSFVSGHVEAGETAEQATVREVKEEAGIDILTTNLRHVFTMQRLSDQPSDDYVDLFFECNSWSGEIQNVEPAKCAELRWFDMDQLPENTLEYIKTILATYTLGQTYASARKSQEGKWCITHE